MSGARRMTFGGGGVEGREDFGRGIGGAIDVGSGAVGRGAGVVLLGFAAGADGGCFLFVAAATELG